MSDTMHRVHEQLVSRAKKEEELRQPGSPVFAWGPIISLLLPVLMEMLMNCFDSKSKESLEQTLVNPTWWDEFWIERITRKAVRKNRDEVELRSLGARDRSRVSKILSTAVMTEATEDTELVSVLLGETEDNNIPDFNDWI